MKKLILFVFVMMFSLSMYAQETKQNGQQEQVKADVSYAFVAGTDDYSDGLSGSLDVRFSFLFDLTQDLKWGIETGVNNYFKEDGASPSSIELPKAILPFGSVLRLYNDNDRFFLGAGGGYALGIDNDGGLYYHASLGFVISDHMGLNCKYSEVDTDVKLSSFSVGIEFSFNWSPPFYS